MDPAWRLLETYHSMVYYAPEAAEEYAALGLKGHWMGYFATRVGAVGEVAPEVAASILYNFSPQMVARSLPDAWTYTTPEDAVAARLRIADRALRRLLGEAVGSPEVAEAARLAQMAVAAGDLAGRPMFAASVGTQSPTTPHLALFWAATALREFRGDGHNAALLQAGIDGCEANVVMAALRLVPPEQRTFRGWTEEAWEDATRRLVEQGLLSEAGALSTRGRRARSTIEQATERAAAAPLNALGKAGREQLIALLSPAVARIVTAGGLPYPNGIGVPPVEELTTVD